MRREFHGRALRALRKRRRAGNEHARSLASEPKNCRGQATGTSDGRAPVLTYAFNPILLQPALAYLLWTNVGLLVGLSLRVGGKI